MDKINKALLKLPDKQRKKLMIAFARIVSGNIKGLIIKKMKCKRDLYRLRVGETCLVFRKADNAKLVITFVGDGDDQTYRDF